MDQNTALKALSALAHPTRLAVFRHLIRQVPNNVPALVIAEHLQVKPSTLSGHLSIMKDAGLVTYSRNQREIRYSANISTMNALISFMLSDCCGGQIGHCQDILSLLNCNAQKSDMV